LPRLLAFLPCEKIIVAKEDNSPNLIGVFGGFKFNVEGETAPSADAPVSLPLRWSTFTFWLKEDNDEGRTYEQRIDLLSPSGSLLLSQTAEFVMTARRHRNSSTSFGFPITGPGRYVLRLTLRDTSADAGDVVTEYPIFVDVATPPGQQATPSASAASVN
jgi:hypothetical protein